MNVENMIDYLLKNMQCKCLLADGHMKTDDHMNDRRQTNLENRGDDDEYNEAPGTIFFPVTFII